MKILREKVAKIYGLGVKISIFLMVVGLVIFVLKGERFDLYNQFAGIKEIFFGILNLKAISFFLLAILVIIFTPILAGFYMLIDFLKKNDYKSAFMCLIIFLVFGIYIFIS
ncbi:DUF1634 domain-containing protein [Deferribacter autotrophicus]|uniref:DUF1634 domain-containing protein n=1 Tax=Deferribacter autotrophicus TaxID=500465 RepID=A0A5A8F662_9BACT|nr:DUF1634 domain-containing protein [Deferribacter autotrophicus]KAA0259537.1 DUF1634 domain-containing protein [Deferribacter autotrophicus]